MSTAVAAERGARVRSLAIPRDPAAQAYLLMRIVFVVAPIAFGLDKFVNVLADDWTVYLASQFNSLIPGSASDAMHLVGVVEIVAGLVVLATPRFGGLLVAAWLGRLIVNLLLVGGHRDLPPPDFGPLVPAPRPPPTGPAAPPP